MDWWTHNKDAITAISATIAAIITVGGLIWAIFKWGFLRGWQRKLRVDVRIFEVITDPAVLLPKLFATENDNSPLADHRITYQFRDPNRDIQTELKTALSRSRYLLITAPTGYGKTREAGMLAQTMILEGWRVLRINTGWLDVPKTLPEELNNSRSRVLILLDDLNGLFSIGERTQSPRAEIIPMLSEPPYHDRLLHVIDMFEGMCTKSEIRVIATARSEAEQWRVLNFDIKDKLWQRFERIELPEPADTTIVKLLDNSAKKTNLKAKLEDFIVIAHKSDGTYRNILLNLRRWQAQKKEVSKNDFNETLNGSWNNIYQQAIKKYPAVKYIYDAIDIMRQVGQELNPVFVETIAVAIWGGNWFQRLIREATISIVSDYLTKETKILRMSKGLYIPSDGQIEAKGKTVNIQKNPQELDNLILYLKGSFSLRKEVVVSFLFYLGIKFLAEKREDEAIRVWQMIPANTKFYLFTQFAMFYFLKDYAKAKVTIQKVAKKRSVESSVAQFLLGMASEKLNNFVEAEAAYREAIRLNPTLPDIYESLGSLLRNLKRYGEAEVSYRKAIELNPSDATVYGNLGIVLKNLKRYDEAESNYRKAIELNPAYATAYNNLAIMLRVVGGAKDALPLLEKLLEIDPEDFNSYLGIASIKKTLGASIEPAFIEKARKYIPEDDFYNRACLESVCDNFDLSFEYLRKATQKEKFNPVWAWEGPDLEWIRDDPRFIEIVGPKPEK